MPGDIVVGDGEGVVVIPRRIAEDVITAAYEQDQREDFILGKIRPYWARSSVLPWLGGASPGSWRAGNRPDGYSCAHGITVPPVDV